MEAMNYLILKSVECAKAIGHQNNAIDLTINTNQLVKVERTLEENSCRLDNGRPSPDSTVESNLTPDQLTIKATSGLLDRNSWSPKRDDFGTVGEVKYNVKNDKSNSYQPDRIESSVEVSSYRFDYIEASFTVGNSLETKMSKNITVSDCTSEGNSVRGYGRPCSNSSVSSKKKKNNSETRNFSCDMCENVYTLKKNLVSHKKSHNKNVSGKQYQHVPPICEIVHVSLTEESGSDQQHKTITLFKCPGCDYVGKTMAQYHSHRNKMHVYREPGCFKCPICEKIFSFKSNLQKHVSRHSKTGSFSCDVCGRIFSGRISLRYHKKRHQEGWIPKTFPCNQCSKTFQSRTCVRDHIESEHLMLEGKFLCSFCGKRFRNKNVCGEHMNVHLNIKSYICHICGKTFTYRSSFNTHKRIHQHDREKPYICPVCSKAFHLKSGLNTHVRTHKQTKDYHCEVCGKQFAQRSSCWRHRRVHNGEKPFVCDLCDTRFNDSSIIRRHMILVHKQDKKNWKENTRMEKKTKYPFLTNSN